MDGIIPILIIQLFIYIYQPDIDCSGFKKNSPQYIYSRRLSLNKFGMAIDMGQIEGQSLGSQ